MVSIIVSLWLCTSNARPALLRDINIAPGRQHLFNSGAVQASGWTIPKTISQFVFTSCNGGSGDGFMPLIKRRYRFAKPAVAPVTKGISLFSTLFVCRAGCLNLSGSGLHSVNKPTLIRNTAFNDGNNHFHMQSTHCRILAPPILIRCQSHRPAFDGAAKSRRKVLPSLVSTILILALE